MIQPCVGQVPTSTNVCETSFNKTTQMLRWRNNDVALQMYKESASRMLVPWEYHQKAVIEKQILKVAMGCQLGGVSVMMK